MASLSAPQFHKHVNWLGHSLPIDRAKQLYFTSPCLHQDSMKVVGILQPTFHDGRPFGAVIYELRSTRMQSIFKAAQDLFAQGLKWKFPVEAISTSLQKRAIKLTLSREFEDKISLLSLLCENISYELQALKIKETTILQITLDPSSSIKDLLLNWDRHSPNHQILCLAAQDKNPEAVKFDNLQELMTPTNDELEPWIIEDLTMSRFKTLSPLINESGQFKDFCLISPQTLDRFVTILFEDRSDATTEKCDVIVKSRYLPTNMPDAEFPCHWTLTDLPYLLEFHEKAPLRAAPSTSLPDVLPPLDRPVQEIMEPHLAKFHIPYDPDMAATLLKMARQGH